MRRAIGDPLPRSLVALTVVTGLLDAVSFLGLGQGVSARPGSARLVLVVRAPPLVRRRLGAGRVVAQVRKARSPSRRKTSSAKSSGCRGVGARTSII
jgi:hypothetical protein